MTDNDNLNDKVNEFFKEVRELSSAEEKDKIQGMGCPWQECYDESTGYPYYWNVNTNAVTWEMPSEYKQALENSVEHSTIGFTKSSVHTPVNKFSNKHDQNSSRSLPHKSVSSSKDGKRRSPPIRHSHRKSSESEDEKIELITSYGEEDSDSDDEQRTKFIKKTKHSLPLPKPSVEIPKVPIGPTIIYRIQPEPQVIKPQKSTETEVLDYNLKPPPQIDIKALVTKFSRENEKDASKTLKPDEDTDDTRILNKLRKQAKVLQELGGELPRDVEKLIKSENQPAASFDDIIAQIEKEQPPDLNKPVKNIADSFPLKSATSAPSSISLVAGYGDDSDIEDESEAEEKPPVKSLFPITESQVSENIKLFDTENDNTSVKPVLESVSKELAGGESNSLEKPDEPPTLSEPTTEFDSKIFQRKRRIALDVLPSKVKKLDVTNQPFAGIVSDPFVEEHRTGFGFQKNSSSSSDSGVSVQESIKAKVGGISFVKAETINLPKESEVKSASTDAKKEVIDGLDDMAELLKEKIKFLEEGKQPVSAVQIMSIQLNTLLEAYHVKGVTDQYLHSWLKGTNTELSKLEQEAVPSGWFCQWDRSNKRYFYRNQQTGHIQWEYPDSDIVGGAEAMDICTTPPPPDEDAHDHTHQSPIQPTTSTVVTAELPKTPPPPQIREKSPSPPPPPIISAVESDSEVAKVSSPKSPGTMKLNQFSQPLPPGVDSPELPYLVGDHSTSNDSKKLPIEEKSGTNLGSELESFYSDIASLDPTVSSVTAVSSPTSNSNVKSSSDKLIQELVKKKKKKSSKLGSGLALKRKEVSLLVEKWKKVQSDF